jgi:hypothetical protein
MTKFFKQNIVVSQRIARRTRAKLRRIQFVKDKLTMVKRSSELKKKLQQYSGLTDAEMETAIAKITEDLENGKEPQEGIGNLFGGTSLWDYGGKPINKSAL